jgi:hypothetical protein
MPQITRPYAASQLRYKGADDLVESANCKPTKAHGAGTTPTRLTAQGSTTAGKQDVFPSGHTLCESNTEGDEQWLTSNNAAPPRRRQKWSLPEVPKPWLNNTKSQGERPLRAMLG